MLDITVSLRHHRGALIRFLQHRIPLKKFRDLLPESVIW
jgi:hypothetical protein